MVTKAEDDKNDLKNRELTTFARFTNLLFIGDS